MKVKICGLTRAQDALLALDLGATHLGMIFAPSPRQISVEKARALRRELPMDAEVIGVFKDESMRTILEIAEEVCLQGVQLHGSETQEDIFFLKKERPDLTVIKTILVKGESYLLDPNQYVNCHALLFDSSGSHFEPAQREPLSSVIASPLPFFLAGGIDPKNVHGLIKKHYPFGIDLSSGVESSPGVKDKNLLIELFVQLKEALCSLT